MTRLAHLIIAATAACAFALPAIGQSGAAKRMQLVKLMDPTGFERPMVAATTVLPQGWTAEGGVIWRIGGDCQSGQTTDWTATSPDGKAVIRMFPSASWRFNNQGLPAGRDCIPAAFNSADQYVQGFMASQLQNSRIIKIQRDPQTMQMLSQYPFRHEMQGDPYSNNWWDAAAVEVEYTYQGKDYSGVMSLFTIHNYTVSGHSFGYGAPLEMGYGVAFNQVLMAAPAGEVEKYMPAFELFMKNYRVNPEWQAKMNRHNQKMSQIQIEANRKFSNTIAKTYSDISDMSMDSWRKRNAMSDTGQRETIEWVRGVETYNADTPTGQVELPTGYDRAFQMNDGTFVVTNDQFFDPMDGQQLGVTQ